MFITAGINETSRFKKNKYSKRSMSGLSSLKKACFRVVEEKCSGKGWFESFNSGFFSTEGSTNPKIEKNKHIDNPLNLQNKLTPSQLNELANRFKTKAEFERFKIRLTNSFDAIQAQEISDRNKGTGLDPLKEEGRSEKKKSRFKHKRSFHNYEKSKLTNKHRVINVNITINQGESPNPGGASGLVVSSLVAIAKACSIGVALFVVGDASLSISEQLDLGLKEKIQELLIEYKN